MKTITSESTTVIERPKLTQNRVGRIKPCKYCGALTHLAFLCRKKPRKPLKQLGKVGSQYADLREAFFKANPAEAYYCYYCLYVGIEIPLDKSQVCVEHYHSKARHPELRFTVGNLVASCHFHNKQKGSLDGDEYLEILKENA